jgi:hypothetical protein
VSLRVASERAALEKVETRIVLAQRDVRLLQTEIGTRGRLAQLERWNVKVLALSAPSADQFLNGSFELARLTQPQHKVEFEAPVVLASAPAPERKPAPIGEEPADDSGATLSSSPRNLLHNASLETGTREVPANPSPAAPQSAGRKSPDRPVAAATPAGKKSVDKPDLAAAKPVTKPARLAKADPLAPLPAKPATRTARDSGSAR